MQDTGTTLPRRQLGRYLMDWRTRTGFSQMKAAELLGIGASSLQRLEKGLNGRVRICDLEAACDLYGASEEEGELLLELAKQDNTKTWWYEHGEEQKKSFEIYVNVESAAVELASYQPELIPGLLQIPDYVRGLASLHEPSLSEATITHWVKQKVLRQQKILRKHRPVSLKVVVGEAALRRPSGGPKVMAAQLRHLADMSVRPNVTVRVLPFSAGFPTGSAIEPFVIMDFAETKTGRLVEPPVVFLEGNSVGDLYLEKPELVESYRRRYGTLAGSALDENASRLLLRQIAKEYTDERPSRRRTMVQEPLQQTRFRVR